MVGGETRRRIGRLPARSRLALVWSARMPARTAILASVVVVTLTGCSVLGSQDGASPAQGSLDGPVEQAFAAYEDCRGSPTSFSVYLAVGVSAEQVDEVARALSAEPAVTSSRYLDVDETYRDFVEFFSDEPEITELVEPEQLPTSFEIEVDSPDFVTVHGPGLTALDGVDSIEPRDTSTSCVEENDAVTAACTAADAGQRPVVLWVWLPGSAPESTDPPSDLQAVLDRSPIVTSTTYQSSEESIRAIADGTDVDIPQELEAELPWSYLVTVRADTERTAIENLIDDLDALATVDAVGIGWDSTTDICIVQALLACRANPTPEDATEVKIWLDVGVSAADVEAVAARLDGLQGRVVSYRYLDVDATYAEFSQYFANETEILDLVDPDDLPTSFDVVLAPGAGVVIASENTVPDNTPPEENYAQPLGNYVMIDHENGEYSFLAHFQQGSVTVRTGDVVQSGQLLGSCGNTGESDMPHMHYHLQNSPDPYDLLGARGLPMQFQSYQANGRYVERGEPTRGQSVQNR
jgi:cell division protein FtsX